MTTVLLVDDQQDLLDVVSEGLSQRGYQVLTAKDGVAGLTCAVEAQPDCIVIDVKMPGLNGNQLVLVLRGDPTTSHIPLVMLTALAQERDQFIGIATGADQYLIKPQPPSKIHEAIQAALTLTEGERAERLHHLAETLDYPK
ncbi:MAG: response regulator [Ktedonobacterales bacterium]|nr:response regulator [Ktedonobacterales bacterium]